MRRWVPEIFYPIFCVLIIPLVGFGKNSGEPKIPEPTGYVNDFSRTVGIHWVRETEHLIRFLKEQKRDEIEIESRGSKNGNEDQGKSSGGTLSLPIVLFLIIVAILVFISIKRGPYALTGGSLPAGSGGGFGGGGFGGFGGGELE